MQATRSGPCGAPATRLAEPQATARDVPLRGDGLALGFRGFAASFQPALRPFLDRSGASLPGLTRIEDPAVFLECVADMRPDYLLLAADRQAGTVLTEVASVSRTSSLGVLLVGDGVTEAPPGLVLEYLPGTVDREPLALTLRALLRRSRPQAMVGCSAWGELEIDEARLSFSVSGKPVALSLEMFAVLGAMMDRPEWVWPRETLHALVFGSGSKNDLRAIDMRVSRARRHVITALGCDPVRSVRGVGYALVPDP